MKKAGLYIAILGVASMVLPFVGLQIRVLSMIDEMGPGPAWGIKAGIVVLGVALFVIGMKQESEQAEA